LEATGGFEPPNRGFADPRLNLLATSPLQVLFYVKNANDAISRSITGLFVDKDAATYQNIMVPSNAFLKEE
jgi:hypothetical protein